MSGLRRVWVRGPREFVVGSDKGRQVVLKGKNGGPVIKQRVELVLTPKEAS